MVTHATTTRAPLTVVGLLGAFGFTAVAVVQAIDPTFPGEQAFGARAVPGAIAALLTAALAVALARSGMAGSTPLVRAGCAAAALGWVADAAAQLVSFGLGIDHVPSYVVASALLFFGMLPPAVAALRLGRSGWRRWAPLLGVVYLVAASPFFDDPGSVSYLATAGWGLTWVALGAALLTRRNP